jgi:cytochrome c
MLSNSQGIMKRSLFAIILCHGAALFALPANADQALAASRNCMSCHAVDRKLLGPSYKAIADKYRNDKTAIERLPAKVMNGGSGVWGVLVMPANKQVSDAEAKKLVAWILSQK